MMSSMDLESYALAKPGAWRDEPWEGDDVAKVADKIFVFMGRDSVGVKAAVVERKRTPGSTGTRRMRP